MYTYDNCITRGEDLLLSTGEYKESTMLKVQFHVKLGKMKREVITGNTGYCSLDRGEIIHQSTLTNLMNGLQKPNSRFWDHRKIIILSKFPYSNHLSLKTKHIKKSLSFQNI